VRIIRPVTRERATSRETFYDRVYEFIRGVPAGAGRDLGQVALELGSPAAARAVGYALTSCREQ